MPRRQIDDFACAASEIWAKFPGGERAALRPDPLRELFMYPCFLASVLVALALFGLECLMQLTSSW